jgi:hypothetical protein
MARRADLAAAAALLLAACGGDPLSPPGPPTIASVSAAANSNNALSLLAVLRADGGDSARVHFRATGEPPDSTPFHAIGSGNDTLPVLGLRPQTEYLLQVEVVGPGGRTRSGEVALATGQAPDAIRSLRLAVTGTSAAGYTLVVPLLAGNADDAWLLAFDGTGALRWYFQLPGEGWAVEAKQQRNGAFSVYAGRSYGWQPHDGRFVEVTPTGQIVRSYRAGPGLYTDPHDLLLTPGDAAPEAVHLLAYDIQPFDLSARGGAADAPLAVHRIVRLGPGGERQFEWNAADHYTPGDWPIGAQNFDLVHPSSLEIDADGHYVVSLQGVSQVAKVDAMTGAFHWRLGGTGADIVIMDDPLGGFHGQHGARMLPNGNLLLLDNRLGQAPQGARAVEYRLDLPNRQAHLVWEFRPDPAILSPIMGSVQRLATGATLVGFGAAGRVVEVAATGAPAWDAALVSGTGAVPVSFYRAIRIASLYRYEPS